MRDVAGLCAHTSMPLQALEVVPCAVAKDSVRGVHVPVSNATGCSVIMAFHLPNVRMAIMCGIREPVGVDMSCLVP